MGRGNGEAGTAPLADLRASPSVEKVLLVVDEGCDVGGVDPAEDGALFLSMAKLNLWLVPVKGLGRMGDRALRKSTYADGGEIGVLRSSSRLMKVGVPTIGLRSSEGKVLETGV